MLRQPVLVSQPPVSTSAVITLEERWAVFFRLIWRTAGWTGCSALIPSFLLTAALFVFFGWRSPSAVPEPIPLNLCKPEGELHLEVCRRLPPEKRLSSIQS
jgi:hypothetical protein